MLGMFWEEFNLNEIGQLKLIEVGNKPTERAVINPDSLRLCLIKSLLRLDLKSCFSCV